MRIFSRWRLRRDMEEEIREHLEEKIDSLVAAGMPREEALRAARREFGNVTLTQERGREVWSWTMVDNLLSDVRYALRQLRKSPGFTMAAVITLALGIGANTAVFSVLNAVVLRPLPFAQPDQLLAFQSLHTRAGGVWIPGGLSYPDFFDFRAGNHVFEHLVSYHDSQFVMKTAREPLHVDGVIVSWDLFPLLGVQPVLGRGFRADEEKPGTNVVVLSHELWQGQFGGDPGIIGRSVTIDEKPFTVVGVAPAGFRFPVENRADQMWTTVAQDAVAEFHPITVQRSARDIDAIGRLKPGVSIEQARAQMDSIAGALAKQYPDSNKRYPYALMLPEQVRLVGDTRRPLMILMGAVGLVLLIACANIANLLLSRTTERAREFAVRAAIGASRTTVIRQLLTESVLLALLGTLAGLLLAFACLRLTPRLAADHIPRLADTKIDLPVLAFSIALAFVTAILFSLAPALQVARLELADSLKEGARNMVGGKGGLRRVLVIGQIALGLILLSAASLLMAGFRQLASRDLGFRPDHLLIFGFALPGSNYPQAKQVVFADRLLERMANIPGVVSVASGWPLPLSGDQVTVSFNIRERPSAPWNRPASDMAVVSPTFFHTMGIPLLNGRVFNEHDDAKTAPVLVVNKAFAERFFPGEDVVGKLMEPGATAGTGGTTVHRIIGVVANAKQTPLNGIADPVYYFPYKQLPWDIGAILLRTTVAPRAVEADVRKALASLDSNVAMDKVNTMEDISSMAIARPRFLVTLLSGFAGIAVLLTLVGLYGVMAYSVTTRTREIGVRIAVGASHGAVLHMVFREAAVLVASGAAIGLVGALLGHHVIEGMLFGMRPHGLLVLGIACMGIAGTGAVAAYLPARRAAETDPMQALRVG